MKTISLSTTALFVQFALVLFSTSAALAGELGDVLAPIQDSTSTDPAGAQLMIICIVMLVGLVSTIFIGSLVYMHRDNEKKQSRDA
ncbi:MAG: hypothetical protein K2Z81_07410 [Cyanobacteria bacterium]|nr:hypothetical protein [Cyanobacteriota bacterium]